MRRQIRARSIRRGGRTTGVDRPTTGGGLPSQSGSIIGTPSYMSPEQAQGEVSVLDEQTDVFALGSTLCEILTGEPAYIGSRSGPPCGRRGPPRRGFPRLDSRRRGRAGAA